MRIGICDDERTSIERVKKCCEIVCQETRIEYSVCIFQSGEEVLQYCRDTDKARIDLLFLDIEMPGISGTELMEQVKKKYQIWRIVFVTSHLGCMQEAFSQKTIGFLSKPVTVEEVSKKILEVYEDLTENVQLQFTGDRGDPIAVLTDDILYMKGEGSYTRIYVRQSGSVQGILISKTLGTMEKELEKLPFIRVHKSYIVNVTKIRYLNTEVHLLECETRIPVGRFYKNVVKETYFEYGKRMISRK